jgi:hypothetical protein
MRATACNWARAILDVLDVKVRDRPEADPGHTLLHPLLTASTEDFAQRVPKSHESDAALPQINARICASLHGASVGVCGMQWRT